jgi:hypothetical protein
MQRLQSLGFITARCFGTTKPASLSQLGIAHEPRDGLRARSSSGPSSFSSAESASPFSSVHNSPRSVRDRSTVPSEPDSDISISSGDTATFFSFEDDSSSTTGTSTLPAGDKPQDYADIDLLDLDFFGLGKDSDYGM